SLNNDRTPLHVAAKVYISSEVEELCNVTHSENSVCTFSSQYGLYYSLRSNAEFARCVLFSSKHQPPSSRVVPKEHPFGHHATRERVRISECVTLHNPSTLLGLKNLHSEMYRCFLEHNIDYTNIDYTHT
ncbi:Protein of unknown function, partial [Gryllus bimaculatus]